MVFFGFVLSLAFWSVYNFYARNVKIFWYEETIQLKESLQELPNNILFLAEETNKEFGLNYPKTNLRNEMNKIRYVNDPDFIQFSFLLEKNASLEDIEEIIRNIQNDVDEIINGINDVDEIQDVHQLQMKEKHINVVIYDREIYEKEGKYEQKSTFSFSNLLNKNQFHVYFHNCDSTFCEGKNEHIFTIQQ